MSTGPFRLAAPARERVLVRRRSPARIVLTLVLFLVVMFFVAMVIERAGTKAQVLVLAQRVVQAQEITRADLTSTDVAGNVSVMSVDQLDQVVGQRAAFTLEAGTILQPTSVMAPAASDAGQASLGVSIRSGMVPHGLQAGDTVRVALIPDPDGSSNDNSTSDLSSGSVLVDGALVADVSEESSSSGDLKVTLRVASDSAMPLLVAASREQIGLIRVGGS
ncbi:SAF domain-containing protein [Kineosporia babensis]|uniref:SAF domain-containing protein n=1 Tax=Kineosporia babensis TaxID=499548 RepID=A0A9X1T4N7_9ACTN|nr:SAF domain-containing protein [Kineosporia babensis]MCD5316843.1 SAF domain-containing protein [Kineosporia babensis]